LKVLNDELFPIKYADSFYDSLVETNGSPKQYITIILEADHDIKCDGTGEIRPSGKVRYQQFEL
jgi:hypothetical protein